jgi:beta-glucosidase
MRMLSGRTDNFKPVCIRSNIWKSAAEIQIMRMAMKQQEIKRLVSKMSLEEKAGLCSGMDFWHTKEIKRLGVPAIRLSDGPHGVRKVSLDKGLDESLPATCFPTEAAMGSSWDKTLLAEVGRAIGREAQAQGVQLVLGPGLNMKRSPLCGRNFEYYSEDPVLTAELAAAFVEGMQDQGVGACVKHFAVNNQETDRMRIDAIVAERALREIYLSAFEKVIKKALPMAVMAAYNKINGEYCNQNRSLLYDVLQKEWNFKGFTVSDWGAIDDRVRALNAGLHLQMPFDGGISDKKIIQAVKEGKIEQDHLDDILVRLLHNVFWAHENKKQNADADYTMHHTLARKAAAESIVLLKNERDILPIETQKYKNILVAGAFAKHPRFQGSGSSQINPTHVDIPYDEIKKAAGDSYTLQYAQGYSLEDKQDETLIQEACTLARNADIVVVLAGLPDLYESEGYDREHLDLPTAHNTLIAELAKVHSSVVVVLQNGSALTMPWLDEVEAVLETWLGGQAVGGAIADVLFGKVNPCGKLAESFARRLEHTPAFLNWPGRESRVHYGEGIFIGYRYYEKKEIDPLFAFGHGLSYTSFEYSKIKTDKNSLDENDTLNITCSIKNKGNKAGKEVVQLYLGFEPARQQHPLKRLSAFRKIELQPGEQKEVGFTLGFSDFAYYSARHSKWICESGVYKLSVGSSSRDIRLCQTIKLHTPQAENIKLSKDSTFKEWLQHPQGKELIKPLIDAMLYVLGVTDEAASEQKQLDLVRNLAADIPICRMSQFSQGKITEQMIADVVKNVSR